MKIRTYFTLLIISVIISISGCAKKEVIPPETVAPSIPVPVTTVPEAKTSLQEDDTQFLIPGDYLCRYDSITTGDYLDYYLFIPEEPKENMPLVIFLHGDGEVGNVENLVDYGPIGRAKEIYDGKLPFYAISPGTRECSWTTGTIPDTLMELINFTIDSYAINREKIIITGHSRGAIGTWYLISKYGDFFSAAVPVSCDNGAHRMDYDTAMQVPVRAFVGELGDLDEKYQPTMGHMCWEITRRGGDATLQFLFGYYHNSTVTESFTPELFQWMLEQ